MEIIISNYNNNKDIITKGDYANFSRAEIVKDFISILKEEKKKEFLKEIKGETLIYARTTRDDDSYIKFLMFVADYIVTMWTCTIYDDDTDSFDSCNYTVQKIVNYDDSM